MTDGPAPFLAVVPLKAGEGRKSRLADRLSPAERARLAHAMAARVLAALAACPRVARIAVLSAAPVEGEGFAWIADGGRGLNAELEALRADAGAPLLVVHGDLPLLGAGDISALLEAADKAGTAIAPDRHGEGTNAVAILPDAAFRFAFGPGSRALHARDAGAEVVREGLGHDVDSPGDLDALPAGVAEALLRQ